MSLLQGCSELNEAAQLVAELLGLTAPPPTPIVMQTPAMQQPVVNQPVVQPVSIQPEQMPDLIYRGDKLEFILSSMCRRGGLIGAVVADSKGLPLADFNSPVGGDTLAAFTSVLGEALARAGSLLGETGAELISIDINYTDKVVLRRFGLNGEPYFLLVICPQDLDERTELELSIEQLTAVLSE